MRLDAVLELLQLIFQYLAGTLRRVLFWNSDRPKEADYLWHECMDRSAGFAYVPPPGPTGVIAGFENDSFEPAVSKRLEHENAALVKGVST